MSQLKAGLSLCLLTLTFFKSNKTCNEMMLKVEEQSM